MVPRRVSGQTATRDAIGLGLAPWLASRSPGPSEGVMELAQRDGDRLRMRAAHNPFVPARVADILRA